MAANEYLAARGSAGERGSQPGIDCTLGRQEWRWSWRPEGSGGTGAETWREYDSTGYYCAFCLNDEGLVVRAEESLDPYWRDGLLPPGMRTDAVRAANSAQGGSPDLGAFVVTDPIRPAPGGPLSEWRVTRSLCHACRRFDRRSEERRVGKE